jgi:hypothetical protein
MLQIGIVFYDTSVAFRDDQTGSVQDAQMRGHGVLNDAQGRTNFTGGDAVRHMSDEQTEHIQPGLVAQSRERIDCGNFIYISRFMDI